MFNCWVFTPEWWTCRCKTTVLCLISHICSVYSLIPRLAKSTLTLIPLLGIHQVVFIFVTDESTKTTISLRLTKLFIDLFFSSFQVRLWLKAETLVLTNMCIKNSEKSEKKHTTNVNLADTVFFYTNLHNKTKRSSEGWGTVVPCVYECVRKDYMNLMCAVYTADCLTWWQLAFCHWGHRRHVWRLQSSNGGMALRTVVGWERRT